MSAWCARRSRRAARSMGRWCSWIWTELRPQRVMCGRPSPARWVKVRSAADGAGGVGCGGGDFAAIEARARGEVPEVEGEEGAAEEVGLAGEELEGSVTWMEAARLTAVERMPAVSQVSTGPDGGLGEEAGEAGGGLPWAEVAAGVRRRGGIEVGGAAGGGRREGCSWWRRRRRRRRRRSRGLDCWTAKSLRR